MGKILMLAIANIRKSKSQAVSLMLFVLITAMFLNIGLIMYFGLGSFFDKRAEELSTPHYSVVQSNSITTDEQMHYLKNYPGVTETEKQDAIAGTGDYFVNGSKNQGAFALARADENQCMNPPSLIGDSLPLTGNAIYLPYFIMLDGNYKVGDDIKLYFTGTELHFTVAGGTEEIMFGSLYNYFFRFYVSDEMFYELEQKFPENRSSILSVRMNERDKCLQLDVDYVKEFFYAQDAESSSDGLLYHMTYDDAKNARTMVPMISALLITAFAIILLTVSLIIIRFRINNSIEDGMVNIGALKAIGYSNGQIIMSIALQFGSIAFIGGVLGIMLSQFVIPAVVKLLESQIALVWNPGFDILKAFITIMFTLLSVFGVTFLSARRIKKLLPLTALRGGITTHNFKRNTVPLDKSHGSISLLLALKQLLQGKRQAVMIAVTVAAVTFAAVTGISLNYNLNVEQDAFISAVAGETPDIVFLMKDNNNTASFQERMLERSDVRKAFDYQSGLSLLVDEVNITTIAIEDFSLLEGNMLVNGRYPKHNNEVAVGAATAKLLEKKVGDTVFVKSGNNEKEYLITGTIQIANNYGINMVMTNSSLREVQPDYKSYSSYVYLNDGVDIKAFIENTEAAEGDIFMSIIDIQDQITAQFTSMGKIFSSVAAGILTITVIIVILVLYMVIKSTILRRKRELGIQKALGFTTLQLMNQIALNFTPIIISGVILGSVGGFFCLNPLFITLASSMGVVKAELISPLSWTVATGIALIALAYIVAMLVAWRIRKISAYALITE